MCPQEACCGLLAFLVWHALQGRPVVADLIGSRPSTATNCCSVKWEFCGASPRQVRPLQPSTLSCSVGTFPSLTVSVSVFVFNSIFNDLSSTPEDLLLLLLEFNSLYFGKNILIFPSTFQTTYISRMGCFCSGNFGDLKIFIVILSSC